MEKFNAAFEKSSNIKFWPYVGPKYEKSNPKILVLGESHYTPSKNESEALEHDHEHWSTQTVVEEEYLGDIRPDGTHPEKHVRVFRSTAAMITGGDYKSSDHIWQKLAFYNFIQKQAGFAAKDKQRIDSKILDVSGKAFFEVLDILNPDLVIAWGLSKMYYNFIPQDACTEIQGIDKLYKYNSFPGIAIWHIQHPAQGFSYESWHPEFVKVCKILNFPLLTI